MSTTTTKGHFPKRGERKVNGVWVSPTPPKVKVAQTAADRRNYLRKLAGWPQIKER